MNLIPQPFSVVERKGVFNLNLNTVIIYHNSAVEKALQLRDMLFPATNFKLQLSAELKQQTNCIILAIQNDLAQVGPEGYNLSVAEDVIKITAQSERGLFYGIQTLMQLLPQAIYSDKNIKDISWNVPCIEIIDYPRFAWRGAMLDCSRYFMPKDFIKKFLDILALHKMNSFHWHLTDDQGWRIEIKKYPKLTEMGAWRKETLIGHLDVQPHNLDGKPHGGFYTQDDIREIVEYAKKRHINVVPEIEMPGHAQAAIASYPELGNLQERLDVCTYWGMNPNIVNVEESTITFFKNVLTEVLDLFPSPYIHIGGDEVPKEQWKNSAAAQARMKELGLENENQLQSYFIKRMDTFLTSKGRQLVGWDEIIEGGLAKDAVVMSWRGTEGGITAAKSGHNVVMAPHSNTYFDHYQSHSSEEPLAIGGFLPLEKVYEYEPVPAGLSIEESKCILGAQCQVWTEYIVNPAQVEYMLLPRMCAFSEVVWSPREQKEYPKFIQYLSKHLKRLDYIKVNYRPLK